MPKLTYPEVQDYLVSLVPKRVPEMQKMEKYAEKTDFPIIGPAAGYYLYQIARMTRAKSIFEMGSGYGYSTAWFAKAVRENGGGVGHHGVGDATPSQRARDHLSRLGYHDLIQHHGAEALTTFSGKPRKIEIVFKETHTE